MKEENADLSSRVEEFFDVTAPRYERSFTTHGAAGRTLRVRTGVVLELLGPVAGAVLDVGMGPGVLCAELDRRGWEVSGIDLSPVMVEAARRRLPSRRDRLVQGSIHALPFEDESFDAVVATGVVEYAVNDIDGAVAELARVLRRRGEAIASFPNQTAPVSIWRGRVVYPLVRRAKRVYPSRRPPPPRVPIVQFDRFARALGLAGLEIETVQPVGVMPAPPALAARLEAGRSSFAFLLAVQRVVRARRVA